MRLFKNKKRRLSFAGLILFSFGIMAVFSIFLHDHGFDPFTTDEDCVPCHWTQTAVSLDMDMPDLVIKSWVRVVPLTSEHITIQKFIPAYFGRGPPLFS